MANNDKIMALLTQSTRFYAAMRKRENESCLVKSRTADSSQSYSTAAVGTV